MKPWLKSSYGVVKMWELYTMVKRQRMCERYNDFEACLQVVRTKLSHTNYK